MADEMNLALGCEECLCDVLIETMLDEQIGTFGIKANTGKISMVANPPEPGMQLLQIGVGTQEPGQLRNRRRAVCPDRSRLGSRAVRAPLPQTTLPSKWQRQPLHSLVDSRSWARPWLIGSGPLCLSLHLPGPRPAKSRRPTALADDCALSPET